MCLVRLLAGAILISQADLLLGYILKLKAVNEESHENNGKLLCSHCSQRISPEGMAMHLRSCIGKKKGITRIRTKGKKLAKCPKCNKEYSAKGVPVHLRYCGRT